jgi:hypothetical protein
MSPHSSSLSPPPLFLTLPHFNLISVPTSPTFSLSPHPYSLYYSFLHSPPIISFLLCLPSSLTLNLLFHAPHSMSPNPSPCIPFLLPLSSLLNPLALSPIPIPSPNPYLTFLSLPSHPCPSSLFPHFSPSFLLGIPLT